MKVGQIVAPRQIEIIDIEQPNLADHPDGTVMIKTVHSAICGTDMPSFVLEHPAEIATHLDRDFQSTKQLVLLQKAHRTNLRQETRYSRFHAPSADSQNTSYRMKASRCR